MSAEEGISVGRTGDPSQTDQRVALADISAGRVVIRLGQGRVELGRAPGESVRVRTAATGTSGIAAHSLRVRRGELRIAARHGRILVDLPHGSAGELVVVVKVRRGEITSWGAGGILELRIRSGSVACRELVADTVKVKAERVSLHFAEPPQRLEVVADKATVLVPAGDYAVTAPAAAEVTVSRQPAATHAIIVRAGDARILAAQSPLSLTDEAGCGS